MKKIAACALVIMGIDLASASQLLKCPATKNKLTFTKLSVFDGNPKENIDLAPDNANSSFPHIWTLRSVSPWLVCSYGPKYQQLFTKKITGKLKKCMTVESLAGSGKFDSLKCD